MCYFLEQNWHLATIMNDFLQKIKNLVMNKIIIPKFLTQLQERTKNILLV